jgi:hypothetical protein
MHANKSLYAHALTVGRNKIKNALALHQLAPFVELCKGKTCLAAPPRDSVGTAARVHITTRDALCAGTASHQTYLGLEMQSSMHISRDDKDRMELARMGEKKSPRCLAYICQIPSGGYRLLLVGTKSFFWMKFILYIK